MIFGQHAFNELKEGLECFVILTQITVENEVKMKCVQVVNEFMDVFPEEIPGLPPKEK